MKIIYLNVLKGCKEKTRFRRLLKFILKEKPDVLGLSELYDWDKKTHSILKKFLKKTSFKFYIFGKSENNRHVALFSNSPFKKVKIFSKGFHCAAIKADLIFKKKLYSFYLTHLTPKSETKRLLELKKILKNSKMNNNQIFFGDLNSLSSRDNYDDRVLLQKARRFNIRKFGYRVIRTDVIKYLEKQGLIDIISKRFKKFQNSVPTKYNFDNQHFSKLRIDYIFSSKDLYRFVKSAKIVKNINTETLSDHYPLRVEIE